MPTGWDDHAFYTVTPRHFDAVITKTCQVLVEGHYSGVLRADEHYIPVRRDLSDVDEVLTKVQDVGYMEELAERAYRDLYLDGGCTYREFGDRLFDGIERRLSCTDTSTQRLERKEQQMHEPDRTVEALERLIVTERHRVELLEHPLAFAQTQLGELNASQRPNALQRPPQGRRWTWVLCVLAAALSAAMAALLVQS